jgi:hypothetical protein
MRGLLVLVVVMGVLIVAGTATVAVTILHRMTPRLAGPMPAVTLAEPAGTHIVTVAPLGDRLAVVLQGGGPDRVVILDPATGRDLGRISLARP